MDELVIQDILTQVLPTKTVSDLSQSWGLSKKRYYDQTPPSETLDSTITVPGIDNIVPADSEPVVAVIGVGYVGEHLVDVFASKFQVIGYDVSESRVQQLQTSRLLDPRVDFTSDATFISDATHFLISVPTLLLPDQSIDSSFLRSAIDLVSKHARRGSTVVIESSVAVGMTRELLGPTAQNKGFFAGMSPERVDPGRTHPPARSIAKVVSGLDDMVPGSLDAIRRLYSQAFDNLVAVSKPEVAEMMKLYENCQRMVCIAYANEMADACKAHAIDPYEVCEAAATKPFGYLRFTPSLGVGGHCIPVNPYYLFANNSLPLLQAATEAMRDRPRQIALRLVDRFRCLSSVPRILVVGMGFKAGQSHLANSPGLELAKSLVLTGKVDVHWIDPLVRPDAIPQIKRLHVRDWTLEYLQANFDMIVVSVKQSGLEFGLLQELEGVMIEMCCR